MLHHTGVEILLESISCYLNSYLLLTRSTEEATRILAVPFIYIGEHALAITPWTPSFGAAKIPFDENIPQQPLTPARRPRSSQNLVPLHLVISRMPLHLFAQKFFILPRVFANICQLRDVDRDTSNYSIKANTYANPESIPRVVCVAVRHVGETGPYLHLWPVWIRADALPPGDPTAIQLAASTNGNCSYKRPLLH